MKNTVLGYGLLSLLLAMLGVSTYAGDIGSGKEKSATCVGCHGANGIGLSPEYPNLAGQKEAYLIKPLDLRDPDE